MLNCLLKNSSGFSLIQGMILSGVLAGSALVASRLLTDQKLAQRSAETRDNIEQVHSLVSSVLQNRDHCNKTMAPFGAAFLAGSRAIPEIKTINDQTILKVFDGTQSTTYMNGQVLVTRIMSTYPALTAAGAVRPGYGQLVISYQRLKGAVVGKRFNGRGYGAKDIDKTILLRVQRTSATGAFVSCYAVSDLDGYGEAGNNDLHKQFCEELNSSGTVLPGNQSFFVWDEATSTCTPRHNVCTGDNEINTGINSNGMVECRNIADWMDFERVLDSDGVAPCPAGSSTPRFRIAGGKVRIICN